MLTIKLPDGRYIASDILEVKEFPTAEMVSEDVQKAFERLIFEFHKITGLHSSVLEFLWITEPVENQTFQSRIRVFVINRKIEKDLKQAATQIQMSQSQVLSTLHQLKYRIECVDNIEKDFLPFVKNEKMSHLFTIVKSEQVSGNSFYGWSVLNEDNTDSMAGFIDVLSQQRDCCVSFQLIPTSLTVIEKNVLTEMSMTYEQALYGNSNYRNTLAENPLKSVQYMLGNSEKPLFFSNICIWGNPNACRLVVAKLLSLLQAGQKNIPDTNLLTLDLSKENINVYKHFFMYPWIINERLIKKYRNPMLMKVPLIKALSRIPYMITSTEANTFFRLPLYEKEMRALKVRRNASEAEQFADDIVGGNTIKLGEVISGNKKVMIGCPYKSWTQHALIVGMPGTGKTTFSVNILTQFAKKGIPFLAIEPTKAEYRAMIDTIDDLQIFTPGNNEVSPLIINPFIPPKGIRLEQYIPSLVGAFKAAFSMDGPLEMLFLKAVNACYNEYGWKSRSKLGDDDVAVFGMFEYILCFKKIMKTMEYNKDVRSNLETAGLLRLMNLIEQNSNIYNNINTVSIEDLLSKPTVLELNAIDNQEQKALIMALLLSSICVYTKNNQIGDGRLKNVILIDEAHVLFDTGSESKDVTVKTIQNMILEIRSYGTSIIIADQKPSSVPEGVVSNTNVKVSFRLASAKERTLIAESTDMDDIKKDHLSKLEVGQAYVHFDKLNFAQLVQTEDTRKRDGIRLNVSNEEIKERGTYWKSRKDLLIPFRECSHSNVCVNCDFRIREDAEYFATKYFNIVRFKIADKKQLIICAVNVVAFLKKQNVKESMEKLYNCTIIRFVRKAQLNFPIIISMQELEKILELAKKEAMKEEI